MAAAQTKWTPWYRRLVALAELYDDHTLQEIADRLGVSAGAVSGWRDGKPPKPENVKAAAHAYDFDPLELMRIAYLSDEESGIRGNPKVANGGRATVTRINRRIAGSGIRPDPNASAL